MENKILEFQKKVGVLKKDKKNPYFNSNYADINTLLSVIKPLLSELGLIVVQPIMVSNGKQILITQIKNSEDDKVVLESSIYLPDNLDPQKMGSAITYYRRYSLQALLSLEAEDDDGNMGKKQATPAQKTFAKKVELAPLDQLKRLLVERGAKNEQESLEKLEIATGVKPKKFVEMTPEEITNNLQVISSSPF